MSKLGEYIKEIRTSNNLTLQEFADSLGYTSKSTIYFNLNCINYEVAIKEQ